MAALKDMITRWASSLFPTSAESDVQRKRIDFSTSDKAGRNDHPSAGSLHVYEGELGIESNSGEIFCKRRIMGSRPRRREDFFQLHLPSIMAVLKNKGRAFKSIVAVNHALPADFRTLCLVVFANRALFEEAGIPTDTPLFVSLEVGALPHMQDALEAGYFLPGSTLMIWQREFVKADRIYELEFPIPSMAVISKTVQRVRKTFDIRSTAHDSILFLTPNNGPLSESEFVEAFRREKQFDGVQVESIDPDHAKLADLVKAVTNAACVVGPTSPYLSAAIFRLPDKISLVEITEDGEPSRFNRELISSFGGEYISTSNNISDILSAVSKFYPSTTPDNDDYN